MSTSTATRQARGESKRAEILAAALAVFLANGYLGTNLDDVAAAARASKRTLYAHFGDKEGLFREVIRGTVAPMHAALQAELDLAPRQDAREALQSLAHNLATIIVTPTVAQLRRIIIAEADRFPDLAAEWYRLGPQQTVARIAAYIDGLGLELVDPRSAAEQLLWLSISAPLNRLMFAPAGTRPTNRELRHAADGAAETFWRAFGPRD